MTLKFVPTRRSLHAAAKQYVDLADVAFHVSPKRRIQLMILFLAAGRSAESSEVSVHSIDQFDQSIPDKRAPLVVQPKAIFA